MAKKQYNVSTRDVTAIPRSRRLQQLGVSGVGSVVNVTGGDVDMSKYLLRSEFDELFEKLVYSTTVDPDSGEESPLYAIRAKYGLYSNDWMSVMGANPDASGIGGGEAAGGAWTLGGLNNVEAGADTVPTADKLLVLRAGATHWSLTDLSSVVGLNTTALAQYLQQHNYVTQDQLPNLAGYATQTWAEGMFATKTELEGKLDASVFDELFEKVQLSNGTWTIKAKLPLWNPSWMSVMGANPDAGSVPSGGGGVDLDALQEYLEQNGYATRQWVQAQGYLKSTSLENYVKCNYGTPTLQWSWGENLTHVVGFEGANSMAMRVYNGAAIRTFANAVNKAGDTMTGTLNVPRIQITNGNPVNVAIHSGANGMYFYLNNLFTLSMDSDEKAFLSTTDNLVSLGTSSHRWSTVYANTINVGSTSLVSNLNADMLDGFDESAFFRNNRNTIDESAILTALSGSRSGSYVITHSGWNGSAVVFHTTTSNSGLAFYRPGGSNSIPKILVALDNTSNWVDKGTILTSLYGNAVSATKLQTPRTLTIGNSGKSFDGTANVSWSLDEMGALSKAAFNELFEKVQLDDGTWTIKAKLPLWNPSWMSVMGVNNSGGSSAPGGSGGGDFYNRLDSWSSYSADKAGYVLSAGLGYDLYNRYVTKDTAQVISGAKTFTANIMLNGTTASYASLPEIMWHIPNVTYAKFKMDSSGTMHLLHGADATWISYRSLKAASFIKYGGTASQFLKADGSVDSNSYLTSITKSQVEAVLTGDITSHHHTKILVSDTRGSATLPNTYNSCLTANFKNNSTNGLSDGGLYNGVLHFRAYGAGSDLSGGFPHELGFTANGNIWHRIGASSTTWGIWAKLLDSSNYSGVLDDRYVHGDYVKCNYGTPTLQWSWGENLTHVVGFEGANSMAMRVYSGAAIRTFANAVNKAGDTITGDLIVNGAFRNDNFNSINGNGLLSYHPSNWTGVSNVQWGAGACDSQGVIRSSNASLIHYRHGVGNSTIWDSGNDGTGSGLDADMLDGYHISNYQTGGWVGLNPYTYDATNGVRYYSYKLFTLTDIDCTIRVRVYTDVNYASYSEWILRVNHSGDYARNVYLTPTAVNRNNLNVYIDSNHGVWIQTNAQWSSVLQYRVEKGVLPTYSDLVIGTPPNVIQTITNCGNSRDGATQGIFSFQANAASATRLQGTYSLWGQNFYGNNVSGNMVGVGNINTADTPAGTVYMNNWFRSIGNTGWYSQTYGGGWYMDNANWIKAYQKPIYTAYCASEGAHSYGVGIKCYSPNHTSIEIQGGNYTMGLGCHSTGSWHWWHGTANGKSYVMTYNGSVWAFTGRLHSTTGLTTDGYASCLGVNDASDARLKEKILDVKLPVWQVAQAPLWRFRWKNGKGCVDVGSIAQYWQEIMPELVRPLYEDQEWLGLDYGKAALISAVSVAKEIIEMGRKLSDHDSEISRLKAKIKDQDLEILQLRRQLAAVERRQIA